MPRQFKHTILRLAIAGISILIAFPVGATLYIRHLNDVGLETVQLHNLQAAINNLPSSLTLQAGSKQFLVSKAQLTQWTEPYTRSYTGQPDVRFSDGLNSYLNTIAQQVDRDPVDARFAMTASGSATILEPAKTGQHLDIQAADAQIQDAILAGQTSVNLALETTQPDITADTISNLGINTRLAVGQSNFSGSTAARIQNIKVSSKLYNGLIIKAGEHFSFNDILGTVDDTTGYAPEKVIKDGKIEYEYGGGICQVSTTLFRAAVFAGLPILERKNHAFPVHYYEPQGFDATIYPGSSDLRFVNDTGHDILLQTHISGHDLYFEMYGTSDGRQVAVDGPHQYDIQPDGSMKAYVARTITYANGLTKTDQFNSVYKAPGLFPTEPNPYE